MQIETPRLLLLKADKAMLKAALKGDEALSELLKVQVPKNWSEFGTEIFQYVLERLKDATEDGWWTYFPIHKADKTLIGSGGYKGKPTTNEGMVEIGYEIAPAYRNQGFATEMAQALVQHAFANLEVNVVLAHTLGEPNHSTRVLAKCGFSKIAEFEVPEEGLIWQWEKTR